MAQEKMDSCGNMLVLGIRREKPTQDLIDKPRILRYLFPDANTTVYEGTSSRFLNFSISLANPPPTLSSVYLSSSHSESYSSLLPNAVRASLVLMSVRIKLNA